MAIRLLDLQLIYGVAGAREHFEQLCADLIQAEYPGAKTVRGAPGDGGVDIYVGDWADLEGITVFQVKFFPAGLGESQKSQVCQSFQHAMTNPHSRMKRWILCLPVDLSEAETAWFTRWKQQQTMATLEATMEKHEYLPTAPDIADLSRHAALIDACFICALVNYQISMNDSPIPG